MPSYSDGNEVITVTEGGHVLELLGWTQVEEVVPSQGDGAGEEPAGDAELVEGGGPENLEDLTNDQLKHGLERRGLPTRGNKAELIERLQDAPEHRDHRAVTWRWER